jgi:predicted O-methyltransferase YrrM
MGLIVPDAIERYLSSLNRAGDRVLDEIAKANETRGLPLVDAEVGGLLRVLAMAVNATRILEIGTAVGYSGIWLAGALPPGGMLFTMEMNEARAREARENFARAGLSDRVSIMVGDAKLKLAKVSGPFDLVFQDGDKQLYTPLLDRLVALLRPRGLLVTDNVLWDGEAAPGYVKEPKRDPQDTRAVVEYNERVAAHPDLLTAIVPLRDGVSIALKRGEPATLRPGLDALARATAALRAADFNANAAERPAGVGQGSR